MSKSFVRALFVGVLFVVLYYAIQILQGMYLTMTYVPDIAEQYESIETLQHSVSFGVSAGSPMRIAMEVLGLLIAGIAVYYTIMRLRKKRR